LLLLKTKTLKNSFLVKELKNEKKLLNLLF
jgi:hypothetical protein